MNILDQHLILFAVMTEFLATTPSERIEQEHQNSVISELQRVNAILKENAAYRTILNVATEAGFFSNGELTKKGHARSLASLKAPMRPSYRSVNYDALLAAQQFKGLLLLASKVSERLATMVNNFDQFEPSEQVTELLEKAGDNLYSVAGIAVDEEIVAEEA